MKDKCHTANLQKDRQDEFVDHKIVGHRQTTNGLQYQARWYGYVAKDDAFELLSNILLHFISKY